MENTPVVTLQRARSELMSALDILRSCSETDARTLSRALERVNRTSDLLADLGATDPTKSRFRE